LTLAGSRFIQDVSWFHACWNYTDELVKSFVEINVETVCEHSQWLHYYFVLTSPQLVCENPLIFNTIHYDLVHANVDLQDVSAIGIHRWITCN
jgi:hypothetical protein